MKKLDNLLLSLANNSSDTNKENIESLLEMFELQKKLNDETNGDYWEVGVNKFGKHIDWLRCIDMELSELIDSTPWKHWKNILLKPDLQNIHIELVDIWHFIMSYIIQERNIVKGVEETNNVLTNLVIPNGHYTDTADKLKYIILQQKFEGKNGDMINEILKTFWQLCAMCGLTFHQLVKIYLGKNCLNKFRQEHGYKEGTYVKIWGDVEDNVRMMEALEELTEVTFNNIYNLLEEKYKQYS